MEVKARADAVTAHTLDVLSNGLIGKHVIMLSVYCILFGGRNM